MRDMERLTPYLLRRALRLSPEDRADLAERLRASLVPLTEDRLGYLADKLAELSGVDVRTRLDRNADAMLSRMAFVFAARKEGFTQKEIGRRIGRDHSSVLMSERRMREIFSVPAAYKHEINFYNKYIESL